MGMARVPSPCTSDDAFQVGVARLPSELPSNLIYGGNQHCRLEQAARRGNIWDGVACDVARCCENLLHALTLPCAEVVDAAALIKGSKHANVRHRHVSGVDIVPYTRAVRR